MIVIEMIKKLLEMPMKEEIYILDENRDPRIIEDCELGFFSEFDEELGIRDKSVILKTGEEK